MPSLDDLKKRIGSVKSTQKITKAMKMVAAAKLRRAQESAESSRPYSDTMNDVISSISKKLYQLQPKGTCLRVLEMIKRNFLSYLLLKEDFVVDLIHQSQS